MEPRPYDSDLVKEPVFSELGSPVPVRLACAFTGYPPPEVWIEKNRRVVATSIESVWIDILTDGLDDYGSYYCRAENVVNPSKLNYTFEIRRSGLYWLNKIKMCYILMNDSRQKSDRINKNNTYFRYCSESSGHPRKHSELFAPIFQASCMFW